MWIVSQNRHTILFTNKVVVNGYNLLAFSDMEYEIIGTYENEDAAKQELKKLTHCLYEGGKVYEVN